MSHCESLVGAVLNSSDEPSSPEPPLVSSSQEASTREPRPLGTLIEACLQIVPTDVPERPLLERDFYSLRNDLPWTAPEQWDHRWGQFLRILSQHVPDDATYFGLLHSVVADERDYREFLPGTPGCGVIAAKQQ